MKKVSFSSKRPSESMVATAAEIDHWVHNRNAPKQAAAPQEPMKRLTIDISVSLHKQIKSQCAIQNERMCDVIRDMLEDKFGRRQAVGEGAAS